MNITREQYETDIQAAKRTGWDEGFLDRHLVTHERDDNPYGIGKGA